jgi:hypothetical protein
MSAGAPPPAGKRIRFARPSRATNATSDFPSSLQTTRTPALPRGARWSPPMPAPTSKSKSAVRFFGVAPRVSSSTHRSGWMYERTGRETSATKASVCPSGESEAWAMSNARAAIFSGSPPFGEMA